MTVQPLASLAALLACWAVLDAILRPLLLIILVACVVVAVSIAHDAFTTAYSEPED